MLNSVRILAASIALAATAQAYAQSLEVQTKALAQITDAADKICSIVSHAGNSQSLQVKGEVKAQLSGLMKRLADLGILTIADFTTEQYESVIRADLAETIHRNAECKFKVFDKLQEKMIK